MLLLVMRLKMTIKVITQTTAERKAETARLYEACRPYLEQGYSICKAAWKVTGTKPHCRVAWYRDLREYAKTQDITMECDI